MGLETTKGSSCSGSMYLWPALRTLICGRQTTRVPGIEAWLWYQLRTVPGMSPQMMVLGEGRLSLGRNTQHDCSSNWRGKSKGHTLINSLSLKTNHPPALASLYDFQGAANKQLGLHKKECAQNNGCCWKRPNMLNKLSLDLNNGKKIHPTFCHACCSVWCQW